MGSQLKYCLGFLSFFFIFLNSSCFKERKESKVFIIGFNKMGTTTLSNFFETNHVSSIHWDDGKLATRIKENFGNGVSLLDGYENYTVFSDIENFKELNYAHVDYYKELDKQYPNSKFILNIRDVEKWIKSRMNHRVADGNYAEIISGLLDLSLEELGDKWRKDFYAHMKDVKAYFSESPEKLLIFNIETDTAQKLVDFFSEYDLDERKYKHLGKSIPPKS